MTLMTKHSVIKICVWISWIHKASDRFGCSDNHSRAAGRSRRRIL